VHADEPGVQQTGSGLITKSICLFQLKSNVGLEDNKEIIFQGGGFPIVYLREPQFCDWSIRNVNRQYHNVIQAVQLSGS
jgi:hypothetical protein